MEVDQTVRLFRFQHDGGIALRGRIGSYRNARLVADPKEIEAAHRALRGKYGLLMAIGDFFAKVTGRYRRRQFIAVTLGAP